MWVMGIPTLGMCGSTPKVCSLDGIKDMEGKQAAARCFVAFSPPHCELFLLCEALLPCHSAVELVNYELKPPETLSQN